jgi:hypothetical protein
MYVMKARGCTADFDLLSSITYVTFNHPHHDVRRVSSRNSPKPLH